MSWKKKDLRLSETLPGFLTTRALTGQISGVVTDRTQEPLLLGQF